MKIAVTGGIGSGKSYVCSLLKERGLYVYDCDAAAKRLLKTSLPLKDELCRLIGDNAYKDGNLNKKVVAEFFLRSNENACKINAVVHPAVAEDFKNGGYTWMECAILFESGFDKLVDKAICVTAPDEIRIQRIMQRDKISREKALQWIGQQWEQEKVRRLSDYEIVNDGISDLNKQIDNILNIIK